MLYKVDVDGSDKQTYVNKTQDISQILSNSEGSDELLSVNIEAKDAISTLSPTFRKMHLFKFETSDGASCSRQSYVSVLRRPQLGDERF